MTRSYVCGIIRSYVEGDSFMYGTWLVYTRDMTHSYVRHDSFGANLNAGDMDGAWTGT